MMCINSKEKEIRNATEIGPAAIVNSCFSPSCGLALSMKQGCQMLVNPLSQMGSEMNPD